MYKKLLLRLNRNMVILGIDPGSTEMGFAIIESSGDKLSAKRFGTLKMVAKDPAQKLLELYLGVERLIQSEPIDQVGLEKLYFAKNVKTALAVSQARGVILLCLTKNKLPVLELNPNEIKIAVTNYGHADKKMVAKMVSLMLLLPPKNLNDNTTDALAVAIAASRKQY